MTQTFEVSQLGYDEQIVQLFNWQRKPSQVLMSHDGMQDAVDSQVAGGGQAVVAGTPLVQLVIVQLMVCWQLGYSEQVVQFWILHWRPAQVEFTQPSVHKFWLRQVGSGGQSKVEQPRRVQLLIEQVSVMAQPG